MSDREHLPNRRASEAAKFSYMEKPWTVMFSRWPDGRIAEIFVDAAKWSPLSDLAADAAILASLALQHGVAFETVKHALALRGGPLAAAMEAIA